MSKIIYLFFICIFIFHNITAQNTTISIDLNTQYQTIDGFGFFGAQNVWWDDNPDNLYSDEWAELVLQDLGMTIWRNEYYPPEDTTIAAPYHFQDADWDKQKTVVEGLHQKAESLNIPLKVMLTVWSPPANMKCQINEDFEIEVGVPHEFGTKEGGALCPDKYDEFAEWLIEGIQLYEEIGIEVYALSPQNEPYFQQFYNSCFYQPEWYADMLKNTMPTVKAAYPDVQIIGAENLLEFEVNDDYIYWYNYAILSDDAALQNMDIWGNHGYISTFSDIHNFIDLPQRIDEDRAVVWNNFQGLYGEPSGKGAWMTEGSGSGDDWSYAFDDEGNIILGAYDLGKSIFSTLVDGKASAWIWWQGSADEITEHSLMNGVDELSKRYYVCKQFFRYIRPGAKMVEVQTDNELIKAAAFQQEEMDALTVVLFNDSDAPQTIQLVGDNLPSTFQQYITSEVLNGEALDEVFANNIVLPAQSIVTLVHGNVLETPSSSTDKVSFDSPLIPIFPNPSADKVVVTIDELLSSVEFIRLYNNVGQLVRTFKIDGQNASSLELDLEGLASGVYWLKILNQEQEWVEKLIKVCP